MAHISGWKRKRCLYHFQLWRNASRSLLVSRKMSFKYLKDGNDHSQLQAILYRLLTVIFLQAPSWSPQAPLSNTRAFLLPLPTFRVFGRRSHREHIGAPRSLTIRLICSRFSPCSKSNIRFRSSRFYNSKLSLAFNRGSIGIGDQSYPRESQLQLRIRLADLSVVFLPTFMVFWMFAVLEYFTSRDFIRRSGLGPLQLSGTF